MYEKLARLVVEDTLRIDSKDVVNITTWDHTIDVANTISVECFKKGADAIINLWTDDYYYGLLENLSESSLREPSKLCQAFTETITASIGLGGPENPDKMKKIAPSKFAAWFEGERAAHFPRSLERKIRNANIALGMVTKNRAKTYGFNFGSWKKVMDHALTADLKKISKKGRELASILAKARSVQVTSASGTNLTLQLAGRPVHVDDGIVDNDDIANENFDATLPAGYVYTTVDETSANGKVAFDLPFQQIGVNVLDLEWSFDKGKLASMVAKKNVEPILETWKKSTGDKDRIATLGIGLNPEAEYGYLMNNVVEGSISIGIGDSEGAGGKNKSSYGLVATMGRAYLEVDGRPIIKNGQLLLQ